MFKSVTQVLERRITELEREAIFLREHLRTAGDLLAEEGSKAAHMLADAYRKAMDFSHPTPGPFVSPSTDSETVEHDPSKSPSAFAESLVVKSDPKFKPADQETDHGDE